MGRPAPPAEEGAAHADAAAGFADHAHADAMEPPPISPPVIAEQIDCLRGDAAAFMDHVTANADYYGAEIVDYSNRIGAASGSVLDIASVYNEQGRTEVSKPLVKFSHKILLVGKKTACFMKHLGIGLGVGAGRASTTVKMMLDGLVKMEDSLCSDPIGYLKSINQTMVDAEGCLIEACISAVKDPEQAWGSIKDLVSTFQERFHEASWDEVAEASGAFAGHILTLLGAAVGVGGKARMAMGVAGGFVTIVRAEIVATAAAVARTPAFQSVLRPMATSCRETALFLTSGIRSPMQLARRIADLRSIPGKDARRAFMRVCGCLGKNSPGAPQAFKEALEKFASTPGFSDRADAIVGRIASANGGGVENAVKGAYYELEVGLRLARAGEKIMKLGEIIHSARGKAEFDIITANRAIECKNIIWRAADPAWVSRFMSNITRHKIVALETLGKELTLFSKGPIPDSIKTKLIAKGINFIEGGLR